MDSLGNGQFMCDIKKRKFIKMCVLFSGYSMLGGMFEHSFANAFKAKIEIDKFTKEADFYRVLSRGVRCLLCPNMCMLSEGQLSICQTRVNIKNKLYTIAYGNPCSVNIDPIEKKPLLHFLPSSTTYSFATAGCNFSCLNCQNYQISQTSPRKIRSLDLPPDKIIQQCIQYGCESIAYTYTEPTVFYEFMYDTAKMANHKGIKNVMISNGYINQEPLEKLIPYLDAANIDLKSFDDEIYQTLNGGRLKPVLNTLLLLKKHNVWLEITNLIVPTYTDNLENIQKMCEWLVANGFNNYPIHFSRFFPAYKLNNLSPTPIATLLKARDIAKKSGMNYVYVGNVRETGYEDTHCPSCNKIIVRRKGFQVITNQIKNGNCPFCKTSIHGVWIKS